jgi:tRNA threonylcarbamoyladenosine biosynthesis protein TsaB
LLLAIDTSAGTTAAVLDNEKVLSLVSFDDPFGHAENIGIAITQAILEAGLAVEQISAVAIGRGPAPYTGLRVGMAAGLGFAAARNLPIFGVMTLDAVAHANQVGQILVLADAKRKELFARQYDSGKPVTEAVVIKPQELENYPGIRQIHQACDASLVGIFVNHQLASGIEPSEISAIYLRSPDVSPSKPKKVTG